MTNRGPDAASLDLLPTIWFRNKDQLVLLLREWYMHPNGQLPAYEWNFSDVNPPLQAWAAWRVYKIEQKRSGTGDRVFLERVFHVNGTLNQVSYEPAESRSREFGGNSNWRGPV